MLTLCKARLTWIFRLQNSVPYSTCFADDLGMILATWTGRLNINQTNLFFKPVGETRNRSVSVDAPSHALQIRDGSAPRWVLAR